MSEWVNWTDQRPPARGLYWWRIGRAKVCGMEIAPEWVSELRCVGMGYGPNEDWPGFSDWDGYNRTVPTGTQWKPLGDAKAGDIFLPGIDFKPCPFDGQAPRLTYSGRWATAAVYRAESFSIGCQCGRAKVNHHTNLSAMIARWNERT